MQVLVDLIIGKPVCRQLNRCLAFCQLALAEQSNDSHEVLLLTAGQFYQCFIAHLFNLLPKSQVFSCSYLILVLLLLGSDQ